MTAEDFSVTQNPYSPVKVGFRQRRVTDAVVSAIALILLSPLFVLAAVGILLSSPGPIMYVAKRVGLGGSIFKMYKFRTMHVSKGLPSRPITAANDPRVFGFGSWLRLLKVDELPQLFNILKGEMSIVGPRPEDPEIVERFYTSSYYETLQVLPGLASPGSIYNYTHGNQMLTVDEAEQCYAKQLLPIKLALDIVYVREASFFYDIRIIARTIWVILCTAVGKNRFGDPPEITKAIQLGLVSRSI